MTLSMAEWLFIWTMLLAVPAACAGLFRLTVALPPSPAPDEQEHRHGPTQGHWWWSIVGGVAAGLLLGPTIFGRVAPDRYEAWLVGGVAEREMLETIEARLEADRLAAREALASPEVLDEISAEYRQQRNQQKQRWEEAKWEHQQPLRFFAGAIIALAMLGATAARVPGRSADQSLLAPVSIGLWAAAIPGGLAYVASVWWWNQSPVEAAITVAAVTIGPWALTQVDRQAADEAEVGGAAMIQAAGYVASVIGLGVLGWALYRADDVEMWPLAPAMLALPLGWLLPRLTARGVLMVVKWALLPALAAIATIRVDLIEHITLWPLLVLIILSGDGRWIGAYLGAMVLGGRRSLRSMRLVMGAIPCGPTQLAVAAVGLYLMLLPETLGLALIAGAVVIEVTTPARRSLARRLMETEEEFDEIIRDE